ADGLHSHVQVAGSLGRVGAIDPDLRLQARIDLRDLRAFGLDADVSGRVTAAGRLSGTGEAMSLDAKIQGGKLRISSLPVDSLDAHLVHTGDLALRARLDASGAVRIAARTVDLGFELKLDGTRPATGGLPRLRAADLVARGRAAGAWPPAVEATVGGSLQVDTATGGEALP